MKHAKDSIRRDRGALEQALKDAGATIKGKAVKCPFHEDKHPSGSIYCAEDGAWRYRCMAPSCGAAGDVFDMRAKAGGRPVAEQLRELLGSDRKPEPARAKLRVYPDLAALRAAVRGLAQCDPYTNPDTGKPDLIVLRTNDKDFIQARPEGGGFVMQAPEKPWPIFNRTRLASAANVVVVEGEKCVRIITQHLPEGWAATTSPGGAGKAGFADWRPLAGKRVVLWPDNDAPDPKTRKAAGIEHMRQVAAELDKLDPAPAVHWLDPEALSLPIKGDVEQFVELYGGTPQQTRAALMNALSLAQPFGASREVGEIITDTINGRRQAIPFPWPMLSALTRALLPGTVTVLCGEPGSVKSFALLQAAAYWHASGVKVALYELEEDRAFHLLRALAQADQRAELTDDEWVRKNPHEAKAALARHRDFLDSFGRRIHTAPDRQVTIDELAAWVEQQCAAGCRIVAVDPVTMAATSEKSWIDDLRFMAAVKTSARRWGASIILVTHPRKGSRRGPAGLDDLAGGAAYQRFSQTVLWLERPDDPQSVRVHGSCGAFSTSANRVLKIKKARNGMGAGAALAFDFDAATLRLAEHGKIVGEATGEPEPTWPHTAD